MPDEFILTDPDGQAIVVFEWAVAHPRAVVHVMHGWCEHASRYDRFAASANAAGFTVCADDHRGHGQTGVRSNTLGDLGPRGMDGVVDACHAVTEAVRARHPGPPVFVLGHSWGSFILQRYLRLWGGEIDGAIFTGTTSFDPALVHTPEFNAAFVPVRTPYDWLSRDPDEVDRYIADPLCGFELMTATGTALDITPLLAGDDRDIPATLPIAIFNGSRDPVGGAAGGERLAEQYREAGVRDVTLHLYPEARHELFNETNRDEVTADVLAWLAAHTN